MVSLLIPLVLAPAAIETPLAREPDPPVQVWLSSNGEFERGDRARVYVRAEQDGYLLVMHADADGVVRVLFPLDPGQDEFVRGGEDLEIRGRGDRDAFLIDERTGTGTVLAAWSPDPFHFADVTLTDHWDYRAIAPNGVGNDAEAGLLDLADHFAAGQRYYYDVAEYIVGAPPVRSSSAVYVSLGGGYCYSCWSFGWSSWNPGFYFGISLGSPWRYRPIWYDPWYSWGSGWYDSYWWYRPVFRHAWNPYGYYWRWPTRRYPRYGVHIRYADGCWGSPFCNRWDPHRGRPGRATGVGFGHDSWRYAYGLTEPRETPGLGIGRVARQVSDVRGTQPRRFGDGLATSPDRMRTAVQTRSGATDARATNGIARSSDVRDRSAQVRAGATETGRFEARRNNGISGAVRNGQSGQAASGRSSGIRSSVETRRGIARARENAVQPRQESSRASTGIRASDGGRPAMSGSGTTRSSGSRSWIIEIPPRDSRGSASERSTGSTTSRSSGIRSSVPRSSVGSGTTGNVRSQSTQIIRSGSPRSTTESRSSSGIRSSVPRSSAGSGTTGNIRSRSTQIIRSGPPRTTTESRSSSGIRSRAGSNAVPRSSSPPARSSSGVRSSAPPVRSGSGAIRSRVSPPSRSAPPRSSSSRASSSSGRTSSIRGSATRSSSSAGSARVRSSARSSGSSSRSSASASRGSSSRGSASASRGSGSRSGGSRGVASARRKN